MIRKKVVGSTSNQVIRKKVVESTSRQVLTASRFRSFICLQSLQALQESCKTAGKKTIRDEGFARTGRSSPGEFWLAAMNATSAAHSHQLK